MTDPYYAYRFRIWELTDLGQEMIDVQEVPADQVLETEKNIEEHVNELRRSCPEKNYFWDKELINDEMQGTIR